MSISISNRLLLCSSLVRPGERVADVGCDHGYLGIYLLQQKIASSIYASDVNKMPLLSAQKNAERYGFSKAISFFLSDGLQNVPRDFDCAVIAGMGADTMINILQNASWLKDSEYHLILQCQSKRSMLRKYLAEEGFQILSEDLAKDGKFVYPVMNVIWNPAEQPAPWEFYITPQLLNSKSPLLPEFMSHVIKGLEEQLAGAERSAPGCSEELRTILDHIRAL